MEVRMLIVAGTLEVDPERRDEFLAARADTVRASRSEPGCLDYVMSADPTAPGIVRLFERWTDGDALALHIQALRDSPRDKDGAATAVRGADIVRYEISTSGPLTG
jgi:quinol monooxygenase YgiN